MLHGAKTVIRNDFDQETTEKMAPAFILRLDVANCINREPVKYYFIADFFLQILSLDRNDIDNLKIIILTN